MDKNGRRGESRKRRREVEDLKKRVKADAAAFFMKDDLPPELAKPFLEGILDHESAPLAIVRDVLGVEVDPPRSEDLDDESLRLELDKLLCILATKRIHVCLQKGVPRRRVYQYILEEVLDAEIELVPVGNHVFNGCGGDCTSCFQLQYCETAKREWPELFKDRPE